VVATLRHTDTENDRKVASLNVIIVPLTKELSYYFDGNLLPSPLL
jgi:hypothetical protein